MVEQENTNEPPEKDLLQYDITVGLSHNNPLPEIVVEPPTEIVEPPAEIVEPPAEIVDPHVEIVEPHVEIVEQPNNNSYAENMIDTIKELARTSNYFKVFSVSTGILLGALTKNNTIISIICLKLSGYLVGFPTGALIGGFIMGRLIF